MKKMLFFCVLAGLFSHAAEFLKPDTEHLLPGIGGNARNSEGSFVTLADGTLLFMYTRYREGREDYSNADIAAIRSADNGISWSKPETIFANPDHKGNMMSVSLLRLQNGEIACFFLKKTMIGKYCDCRPMVAFSSDEGKNWSVPRYCFDTPGYFVLNNDRVIQLKNGRLLMPVALHRYASTNSYAGVISRAISIMFVSDDNGKTFYETADFMPEQHNRTGLREPGVVELADGRIMAYFRTGTGAHYLAYSSNNGNSWTVPVKSTEFTAPDSPLSIKRDPENDRLVAIWNHRHSRYKIEPEKNSWKRTPLVIAFSDDEGKTWYGHQIIAGDPAHGYCYTAIHFYGRRMFLGYCCGGASRKTNPLQDLVIQSFKLK